jgi:hypothetical protein
LNYQIGLDEGFDMDVEGKDEQPKDKDLDSDVTPSSKIQDDERSEESTSESDSDSDVDDSRASVDARWARALGDPGMRAYITYITTDKRDHWGFII